jgi:hypothetical protein
LRGIARSSENLEKVRPRKLLWLYIPNFLNHGAMESIDKIANSKNFATGEVDGWYWEHTENCAGFKVSDDCEWRYEEMSLISYTP